MPFLSLIIDLTLKAIKSFLAKTKVHCFRYDPHTAYRSQAVGGDHQSHGHADGQDGHTHGDGHGHAMGHSDGEGELPLRDDNWEEDGGGGGGAEGSKEQAHRMIANIYPSKYQPTNQPTNQHHVQGRKL